MKIIENRTFSNETIELDGKGFVDCSFTKCALVFRATAPFGLDEKTMAKLNGVTLSFSDGAALTIQALGLLYKSGGTFQQWVEHELKAAGAPISGTHH